MVTGEARTVIVLGYIVAIGVPSAVLVWALAWPESKARQTADSREQHDGLEER
ncbi:hypothetical protein [Nocardia sp. NPDC024068]|uniref:hypothetical protein n=1 Tax=Nocardia sp. NPDC024068 TaxID=3157197 RepID=UPI0033FD139F